MGLRRRTALAAASSASPAGDLLTAAADRRAKRRAEIGAWTLSPPPPEQSNNPVPSQPFAARDQAPFPAVRGVGCIALSDVARPPPFTLPPREAVTPEHDWTSDPKQEQGALGSRQAR